MTTPTLTLWRPWAACFTELPEPGAKRIENRPWTTGYRGPTFLHAGRRWDSSALLDASANFWAAGGRNTYRYLPEREADHPTGIVAAAELVDICTASLDMLRLQCNCGPWAVAGQTHWRFTNVVKVPEPVPCRGLQKLWRPPHDVDAAVKAQLTKAVA